MPSRSFNWKVVGPIRRDTDDLRPGYDNAIIDLWHTLPTSLSGRRYNHAGCDIEVTCEWSPVASLLSAQLKASIQSESHPESLTEGWWTIYEESVDVHCAVRVAGTNDFSEYDWYSTFFLESYLYDLFLILNLALPGGANFINLRVEKGQHLDESLGLASFYFEDA